MRRSKWIALLVGLQLLAAVPMQAAAQQAGTQAIVLMNDKVMTLKAKPVIIAGKTYVSVHDLAKMLHGEAKIENGKTSLRVGLEIISYQPEPGLKVPSGYMPLRMVAEKNGYKVNWNGQKQAIYLTKGKGSVEPGDGFTPIDASDLTSEEKSFVEENKTTAGVHKLGNLYMIALGSKPNPGYGIGFVKNVQSWEQLFVHVKLSEPQPGKMYPQVIAYPYLLGRAELPQYTTMLIIDDETGEQLFVEK